MVKEHYFMILIFLLIASMVSTVTVLGDNTQNQDVKCLATALMSEASIGTNEERTAVAWTIFNRVNSPKFPNSICDVVNQPSQYATNQEPTQELLDLATSLIANPGTDPTGGAIYFFSPRSMPAEGEGTRGYDVDGGLHDVVGIDKKVYFPSFTLATEYVGDIPGVRPAYYMFYREPTNAAVAGASNTETQRDYQGTTQPSVPESRGQSNYGEHCIQDDSRYSYCMKNLRPNNDEAIRCLEQAACSDQTPYCQFKDPSVVDPFIQILNSRSNPVYGGQIAKTLGCIGDIRAVDPLIQALNDENANTRDGAAYALGMLRDTRAVDPLIQVLNDASVDRSIAATALGEIGDAKAVDPLTQVLLNDKNAEVRQKAAEALGNINDKRAVEPLIQALTYDDLFVQCRAAEALGKLKDTRAVDPLIQTLKSYWIGARSCAAEALGEIGDRKAIDPLREALNDEQSEVKLSASNALKKIEGKTATTTTLSKGSEETKKSTSQVASPATGQNTTASEDSSKSQQKSPGSVGILTIVALICTYILRRRE